ncbi:hypothetical protein ACWEVP_28165 [Amycolatopsis sp. NPDC003865]
MQDPDDSARQVLLAEYAALRTEAERRATVQWNVFALQLASAGAIASVAISANPALLLLIPVSSYLFGGRYILHDFHLKLIRRYLRESLAERLGGHIQWETWRSAELAAPTARGWFSVTGWNFVHPTRLAFEGVGWLAVAAAGVAGGYQWWLRSPPWPVIAAFAAGWLVGPAVTVLLHRAFRRASDL